MAYDKERYTEILTNELAQRLYDLDPYEAQDNDETPETLAQRIKDYPLDVMSHLIGIIEDLYA